MPLNPFQMQDLADVLFPSDNEPSSSSFNVTAQGDSSNGLVSVENDGDVVAIPIIGSASAGDELPVLNVGGVPIAIAADGWGDQLSSDVQQALTDAAQAAATTAYLTPVQSGADAGLHVHEDETGYNTGGDFWINPNLTQIRNNGQMVAQFAKNGALFCEGNAAIFANVHPNSVNAHFEGLYVGQNYNRMAEVQTLVSTSDTSLEGSTVRITAGGNRYGMEEYNDSTLFVYSDSDRPAFAHQANGESSTYEQLAFLSDIPGAPERSPYCKAVRTASATTSGTAGTIADLAMQSLEMNYSGFSILGGAVIVPKAGRIKIHGAIHYSSYSSSVARGCYIKRNGAEVCGSYIYGTNVAETDAFVDVNAGDTISIASRASSASQTIDYKSGAGYTNTYLFVEYMDVV